VAMVARAGEGWVRVQHVACEFCKPTRVLPCVFTAPEQPPTSS
jgi:hypothetical protein